MEQLLRTTILVLVATIVLEVPVPVVVTVEPKQKSGKSVILALPVITKSKSYL
ncbi:hypothetical protein [Chitinophaga silvatica]|uniref:hypothetical protein n=1 Tax=Chitinophaga silvatica TaxID=2282649 RepID=UPI0013146EC9|nr:hypothetical protein [Chitinophaga silvatica]